ncbi:MAG: hypothetical protein U0792_03320 [Gemmataceae bacterium]
MATWRAATAVLLSITNSNLTVAARRETKMPTERSTYRGDIKAAIAGGSPRIRHRSPGRRADGPLYWLTPTSSRSNKTI